MRQIAEEGAKLVIEHARQNPETEWVFQYSPESFTQTELDYALEVCESVLDIWEASPENPVILNLPQRLRWQPPIFSQTRLNGWPELHQPRAGYPLRPSS